MKQLLNVFNTILNHGDRLAEDRTGHGRLRYFGIQERFDLSNGKLPVVTTREIDPYIAVKEMLFFIKGLTNIEWLHDQEPPCKIWDSWAVKPKTVVDYVKVLEEKKFILPEQASLHLSTIDKKIFGEIGPMYGNLWRHWPLSNMEIHKTSITRTLADFPSDFLTRMEIVYSQLSKEDKEGMSFEQWATVHYYSAVDQLNELVLNLKSDPYGSRHVVTAFNPEYTPIPGYAPDVNVVMGRGALMPCHFAFQVLVKKPKEEGGKSRLSLIWNQRSVDSAVGLCFNIEGYAVLAHLLAHVTDMETDELIFSGGDCHLYLDHLENLQVQMEREPLGDSVIRINPDKKDLFAIEHRDIVIEGYRSHPAIKYPIAI